MVGEGAHLRAGGPHAEIVALDAAGPAARGATCYVTLEPCAHHGRTPPCADALVRAGVARVVAAVGDPHPRGRRPGSRAPPRRRRGRSTVGVREAEARRLNRGFFSSWTEGRPHVTLKTAMTLDGKIAAVDGASRWITGEAARLEAHRLVRRGRRSWSASARCWRTIPALTVRLPDSRRRSRSASSSTAGSAIPADARSSARGIRRARWSPASPPRPSDGAAALRARGVRVLELPADARPRGPPRPARRAAGDERDRGARRGRRGAGRRAPGGGAGRPCRLLRGAPAGRRRGGARDRSAARGGPSRKPCPSSTHHPPRYRRRPPVEADVQRWPCSPDWSRRSAAWGGGAGRAAASRGPSRRERATWTLELGESVAVSGVCLTVVEARPGGSRSTSRRRRSA